MTVKRINLSFNLDRKDDREVYDILVNENHKTEFIIKNIKVNEINSGQQDIKNALREVLSEYNLNLTQNSGIENIEKKKEEIPIEIFNMFNSL